MSQTNSQVVVIAGQNSTITSGQLGNVILTADTGAFVTGNNAWTQLQQGIISSIHPSTGQFGTIVTIAGQRLFGGGASVANVTLGTLDVTILTSSNSQIIVEVPQTALVGVVDLTVTSISGSIVYSLGSWTFAAAGQVSSVVPSNGQVGTIVTISGTKLRGSGVAVASVTLAGVHANITSESDSQVIVVAQDTGYTGAGDVILVADSGAIVTGLSAWTYLVRGQITNVSPAIGQYGTIVTIQGSHLRGGASNVASVWFGTLSAFAITSESDSKVVAVAPISSAGIVAITLISNSGSIVTQAGSFTFNPTGVVNSIAPTFGQYGTSVTISGSNLLGAGQFLSSVTLAGAAVFSITSQSDTAVVVVASDTANAAIGVAQLVANTGAIVTSAVNFTLNVHGTITAVNPNNGQVGSTVTITGQQLLGGGISASTVKFAGVPVQQIVSSSNSQVVVIAALYGSYCASSKRVDFQW